MATTRPLLGFVLVTAVTCTSACRDSPVDDSKCDRVQARLRSCGLLSSGRFNCAEVDDLTDCELSCIERATCADLEDSVCWGIEATGVDSCAEACASFVCANGETILGRCDGWDDCSDGSDELGCHYFVCPSGEELDPDWQCDGDEDCDDGSDESGCWTSLFACADGNEQVPSDWVCDQWDDCADGSDEEEGCARWVCE